jgi:hypothetical protein
VIDMAAGRYDLYIEQGVTYTKIFTWYDSTNTPIDLSDYTAIMQVRYSVDDDTVIVASDSIPAGIVLTLGGALGTITVDIAASISNALDFDIAVWDINLTHTPTGVITRLLEGEVKFSKAVTISGTSVSPVVASLIGTHTGDIIRWDATLGCWVVKEEPFEFDEIRLVPKASSTGAEGTIFFCSTPGLKGLYVGVEP